MSGRKAKRYMAPFVVSASDLAFIMLFFFIIVGNGSTQVERIEMPYKSTSQVGEQAAAPFRIEIYDQDFQIDSSRMVLIHTSAEPPETSFVSVANTVLTSPNAHLFVRDRISEFLASRGVVADSVRFDVYSSAHSYYGLVAMAMAACYKLDYPCNLVYRAEIE